MLDYNHHGTGEAVMADESVHVEVIGLDKLLAALDRFPQKIPNYLGQAGHEAANRVILPTKGLQNYPPATGANKPPTPYYIRGKGTQTASKNYFNSENLGKQWYADRHGLDMKIGNRASYARWVHGVEQAGAMGTIGWKQLFKTAKDKVGDIKKVYDAWVAKAIRDLGL